MQFDFYIIYWKYMHKHMRILERRTNCLEFYKFTTLFEFYCGQQLATSHNLIIK